MVIFNLRNDDDKEGDEFFELEVSIQPESQNTAMVDPDRSIVTIKIQNGDGDQGKKIRKQQTEQTTHNKTNKRQKAKHNKQTNSKKQTKQIKGENQNKQTKGKN